MRVTDFNILPLKLHRSTHGAKNKTEEMKNALNQLALTEICRTYHPTTARYTFSGTRRIFFSYWAKTHQ